MEYKIIPIHQLNDSQVAELARLHLAVIHSLLSDMGLPFVERYYQVVRNDSTAIGFCALAEDGHLLGWVVGSSKPEQINNRLRKPLSWFIPQLRRVLSVRPTLIWQLIVSSRSTSFDVKPDGIELVYLGVAASARGCGLGSALMDAFDQASKERYRLITLSVEEGNAGAIRLYTRVGFMITDTLVEGNFKRHRMELNI